MLRTPDPSFSRLVTALERGWPDRVPMFEVTIDEEAKEAFLGKPLNDLETDLEFYLKAGYDYISLGRRIAGFPGIWQPARRDNYYDAQRSVGKGAMKGPVKDWDDFKAYNWPKPEDLDFRILDDVVPILPQGMKVVRYMGPVFQMVWMLMGFENFCLKLYTDPGLVDAVFEKIWEVVRAEVDDAVERDVIGAIEYGDDIAIKSGLMVSPEFLEDKLWPKMDYIARACRKRGIPLIYHTDGDVGQVVERIIDLGVDALHPIDPTGMDIYDLKPRVEGRLCVIGNIDVDLLTVGRPDEVVEDTKEHLRRLAPGGGYVVSTSNSVTRNMKPENYRAMLDTVLTYGRYPIQA
jgi:uroporphyrinogen decarboxylase